MRVFQNNGEMQKMVEMESCSISELIGIYSQTIKELKRRGILRTKNVIGEFGEYLVLEHYDSNPNLPNLSMLPVGTKNINAVSQNGERYSIKSTSGNVTGVIYGLEPQGSLKVDYPLFEYIIVCKLDEDYELEGIYQLSWEKFQKHKRWHSRMSAWNIAITKAMKNDSVVIYEKGKQYQLQDEVSDSGENIDDEEENLSIVWNKTEKVNHSVVRAAVAERLRKKLKCNFEKESQSRYVSKDRDEVLFILSASYSQKNGEYWYSINNEIIPWLGLYPICHIAFALGSAEQVLVFPFSDFKDLLKGCLRTQEDPDKKKKAHYHFSFAVEGTRVYFKKKLPEKEYVEVTERLM